jgi:hypothetical protein
MNVWAIATVAVVPFFASSALAESEPREVTKTRRIGLMYRSDVEDIKGKTGWSNGFTGNLF